MSRAKLTVRLPEENLDFLRRYAAEQGVTVTEVLDRYLWARAAAADRGPTGSS